MISQQKSGSTNSIIYYSLFVVVDVEKGYGGCSDTSVWVVIGRTSVEQLAWIRYWREYVIGMNT